jgi:uncharacterized protein (DUF1330 family)
VISDVELLDPSLVEKYRSLAQTTISQYGGRYIIRGGAIEPVEGGCLPKHIVRSTSSSWNSRRWSAHGNGITRQSIAKLSR